MLAIGWTNRCCSVTNEPEVIIWRQTSREYVGHLWPADGNEEDAEVTVVMVVVIVVDARVP
jgi:hypothetical protein